MNKDYWQNFYKTHKIKKPSSFAKFALKYIPENAHVLDIGCGSGRDSYYFAKHGKNVLGVDYAIAPKKSEHVEFMNANVIDVTEIFENSFDVIYSRFFLHAITPDEVKRLIRWSKGIFIAECRAEGDEPVIYTNHKRNLINGNDLLQQLIKENYDILYFEKSYGLAVYKEEDPYIIRVVAQRRTNEN